MPVRTRPGIQQPAVIVMEAQQAGAQKRASPFRVRPANKAFGAVSMSGAAEGPRRRRRDDR